MRIRCAHLALKGAAWLQLVLHVVVGCGWGGVGRGGAGRGGAGRGGAGRGGAGRGGAGRGGTGRGGAGWGGVGVCRVCFQSLLATWLSRWCWAQDAVCVLQR
jgi:hypothetical protein